MINPDVNIEDWYRVSQKQLYLLGYGRLVSAFRGLPSMLNYCYPHIQWKKELFSERSKKASQRWLLLCLKKLFPQTIEIVEDYIYEHKSNDLSPIKVTDNNPPDVITPRPSKFEFDIWIPSLKLAFEYQGEHHYSPLPTFLAAANDVDVYARRDQSKRDVCILENITLIEVPFWWDGTKESLGALIIHKRDDLLVDYDFTSVPLMKTSYPEWINSTKQK
eukprot:TRINITY_DN3427_c0_g1_i2.p1 TRINITY_DN3427_c0_g1~~TRINITY_DN3427_c0_g1_i2.p1  ORF type:complete len:219 (+),score=22.17 TRINITY_DN3427_c0_g1_i2:212-868(+)